MRRIPRARQALLQSVTPGLLSLGLLQAVSAPFDLSAGAPESRTESVAADDVIAVRLDQTADPAASSVRAAVSPKAAAPLQAGFLSMPHTLARFQYVMPVAVSRPCSFGRRLTSPKEEWSAA